MRVLHGCMYETDMSSGRKVHGHAMRPGISNVASDDKASKGNAPEM